MRKATAKFSHQKFATVYKKIVATLLLLCIFLGTFPTTVAKAAEIVKSGTWIGETTWTLDSEGTLTISGWVDANTSTSSFPWKNDSSFRSAIKNVIIDADIDRIHSNMFADCGNLKSVYIPGSVKFILDYAFAYCKKLEKIVFTEPNTYLNCSTNTFTGAGGNLAKTVYAYINTPAQTFAEKFGFTFVPLADVLLKTEKSAISMRPGASETLEYAFYPQEAADKTVLWSSSDERIVTVVDGVVTAVSSGRAVVTGTSHADPSKSVSFSVVVQKNNSLYGGTCGKNVFWELDDTGTLTISGDGSMQNYEITTPGPWSEITHWQKKL